MKTLEDDSETLPIPQISGGGASLSVADTGEIRRFIETSGALLLRGFDTDLDGFAKLAAGLCSSMMLNESPNRAMMGGEALVQSVNLGVDPFPLHPELSREPWRPDVCMFACIGAPGIGGQTNLCDGIAIAEGLPEDLYTALAERKLFYIKPASPQMLDYWLGTPTPDDLLLSNPPKTCPYWFRRANGKILRGFTRPVLEPTQFQGKPAWSNFLLFARDYLGINRIPLLDDGAIFPDEWLDIVRSTARKITYAHRWQAGDVLLVDNSRFMHGRRAIVDSGERQIATYFGYLRGIERRASDPENPVWRKGDFIPPDAEPEN